MTRRTARDPKHIIMYGSLPSPRGGVLLRRASSSATSGGGGGGGVAPPLPSADGTADALVMRSPAFHASLLVQPGGVAGSGLTPPSTSALGGSGSLKPVVEGEADGTDSESEAPFPAQAETTTADRQGRLGGEGGGGPGRAAADADGLTMSFVYGLVNVAVSVPCLYGYAGIIYRDPVYSSALPDLAKLVIFSSAVHQLMFSWRSSMPFAIGQVQDAGLIFLSSMASRIAAHVGGNAVEAVPTAVVVLSLSTALLGLVVVMVGRFRLASFVSLIPTPVIAGYLAFIGFFCGAAGLGLACDKDVSMFSDFAKLNETKDWVLIAPAVATGALLSTVSRNATRWYTLPVVIVSIPCFFYVWMWFSSLTFEDVRLGGWIAPQAPSESVYEVARLFDLTLVRWSVVPQLVLTFLGMCLLVTFASALDVVAVEIDLKGEELDIDRELETVGLSNLVSGLLAGYTGSYIFSQTIFTRRTLTTKRWIGLVLAATELALFLAPFSLMSYVPRFFFAGTLIYIAVDLLRDWLFEIYFRTTLRDYMLILVTFWSITLSDDLVFGIFVGTCTATLNFILLYAKVDPVVPATKSSNLLRDYEARKLLVALASERIISLKLTGFLFFGSSTLILRRVREFLREGGDGLVAGGGSVGSTPRAYARSLSAPPPLSTHSPSISHRHHRDSREEDSEESHTGSEGAAPPLGSILELATRKGSSPDKPPRAVSYPANLSLLGGGGEAYAATPPPPSQRDGAPRSALKTDHVRRPSAMASYGEVSPERRTFWGGQSGGGDEDPLLGQRDHHMHHMHHVPPHQWHRRFLILDFGAVTGVDATVVSSGLLRIKILARTHNLCIIFSSVSPQLRKLLVANHVIRDSATTPTSDMEDPSEVVVADNLNDALELAESELLAEMKSQDHGKFESAAQLMMQAGMDGKPPFVLESSRLLRYPSQPLIPSILWEPVATADPVKRKKAESRTRASFALLIESFFGWGPGGKPSMTSQETKRLCSYFTLVTLRRGQVVFDEGAVPDRVYVVVSGEVVLYRVDSSWRKASPEERALVTDPNLVFGEKRESMQRARFGSMIGDLNFTLQQKRVFGAQVHEDTCLFVLTREKLQAMEEKEPHLAVGLFKVIARSLAVTLINLESFMESEEL